MTNSEFKQLLKEGIDSVANRQSKRVRAVEEAIGEALHVSHHTVQRWKRGFVPNELDRIEFLVDYCHKYGRVDRAWGLRVLTQAGYPAPEMMLDRLFPKIATQSTREMPRVYHNLPPRYGEFIGREAELGRVLEWVENSRWPLASIEGMGGIGKTSLAIEVAHRCLPGEQLAISRPFDAVVWSSARDQADFDLGLDQVLDAIARVLDYTYLIQLPLEQKAAAIDNLLRSQRVLVIVDNFETITNLALVKFLERVPEPSLALITSRYKQLRRVWDIPLYGLKNEETLTLIRRHSHRIGLNVVAGADDDTLLRLAVATGNNPKAVELALGLIKHKGLPFNTVVDELYQASVVVEEVFDYIFVEAWKLLDDRIRRVVLAMPFFVTTASRAALSAVSGVSGFEFHKAIEQLVGMSLLEATEALDVNQQRYQMHPLTQAFARNELKVDMALDSLNQSDNDASAAIGQLKRNFYTFFVEWSRKKGCRGFWDYVSWGSDKYEEICLELPNLLLALEWAYQDQSWTEVLALAKVIVHPVYYQGQLNLRIKCSQYGLTASRKLGLVEDETWFTIQGLGSVYLVRGDYPNTQKYLRRGLELARTHQLSDGIALGETYLAYLTLQTDKLAEAQEHVKKALSYAQGPFFKYRAHHAAGHVARYLQDYEQAGEYYLRSAEFLTAPGYLDTSDVWLGFTKLGQKEYKKAEDYFRHYLETYGKYGNQRVVGMAKLGLALYYEVQGLLPEARTFAHEAFTLLSQMNAHWELKQVQELLERLEKDRLPPS
ncbi:MAG: NB-ARC domain-containing protein [Chloroflexota bacterium]